MPAAGPDRVTEAALAGAAGAVLGGVVGAPLGLAPVTAALAGANGLLSGWRRTYDWRSRRGVGAFVLDSTWALASTTAALACHAASRLGTDPGYLAEWSERRNRHVYRRGFVLRRGFALTVGNVITGAVGDGTLSEPRRVLVDDHEDVHVWQSRWFGPVYPLVYAGWSAFGALAGVVAWLARGRREPLATVVDTLAYYTNPFEWWAYSRQGNWPPSKMVASLAWRRPMVTSFRALRAMPGSPAAPR
jgi:hypothetical protein